MQMRFVFPMKYEICEGHDWFLIHLDISAEGVTLYKAEVCRNCGLEVRRTP